MDRSSCLQGGGYQSSLFHELSLPNNDIFISHLMYVDDVTFLGDWSEINFVNLNKLLCYFFVASGLKVNLHHSKVYGFGVDAEEVNRFAIILKCEHASFPFTYLGRLVGANMKFAKNWISVVDQDQKT
uniref:Reverse transcriptase domain-containing protein n=1 Tax=Lactuca sativa TaxID=4236 RepID=A0A9R1VTR7_LACSA|nr:hypothetical protein LSAT_V11C400164210 [Lactuca sativa]